MTGSTAIGGLGPVDGNIAGTNGGGLYCVLATCTLTDALVSANTAGSAGGGIFQSGGTLELHGATRVRANTASTAGGGVYGEQSPAITIDGTSAIGGPDAADGNTFTNFGAGAGVYTSGSTNTLVIEGDALVAHNTGYQGSGVWIDKGRLFVRGNARIRNNVADGNNAESKGGGVWVSGAEAFISGNAAIAANSAFSGGGVSLRLATLSVSGNAVIGGDVAADGNQATENGGGVFAYASEIGVINEARIRYNVAGRSGGGIAMGSVSSLSSDGGTLADNSAEEDGGGVYAFVHDTIEVDRFKIELCATAPPTAAVSTPPDRLGLDGGRIVVLPRFP